MPKSRIKLGISAFISYISVITLKLWVSSLLSSAHKNVNHSEYAYITKFISSKFTYPISFSFKPKDTKIRVTKVFSGFSGTSNCQLLPVNVQFRTL